MKTVFDTNVLVSALIKNGKPKELFLKAVNGQIELIVSKGILEEFSEVTQDSRIRKYVEDDDIVTFLETIGKIAKVVKVKSRFSAVKEDPDDDAILRTAFDGKADFIVSGDKHLLALKEFREIRIITVDEMATLLKP